MDERKAADCGGAVRELCANRSTGTRECFVQRRGHGKMPFWRVEWRLERPRRRCGSPFKQICNYIFCNLWQASAQDGGAAVTFVNLVQGDDEVKSKRALIVLAELYRRNVWVDERTANVICMACLHKSSRIMIASLRVLLGYDQQKDDEEGDESDSDAEEESGKPSVSVNREAIYKAHHRGTLASKQKKQNKLQRAIRSMQKQQKAESREMEQGSHAPSQHVVDPQSFAEKLFARLRSCNERFEVKMLMMMQVISQVVGVHRLMLLNFYPFLQKYSEPHQRDVTHVLAAAVQACHDLVPPDAVESIVRQLVNHFVHDRARPETGGLSNREKEKRKAIPLGAVRSKVARNKQWKKSKGSGKNQFRGKKAWKC